MHHYYYSLSGSEINTCLIGVKLKTLYLRYNARPLFLDHSIPTNSPHCKCKPILREAIGDACLIGCYCLWYLHTVIESVRSSKYLVILSQQIRILKWNYIEIHLFSMYLRLVYRYGIRNIYSHLLFYYKKKFTYIIFCNRY